MFNRILEEFIKSKVKIKSFENLKKYIEFCFKYNKTKTKGKTSHHHILPKKLFPEYSNLKENKWNGTHILYSDHYYAHWLLTEAIDDYGQLSAFCAMHNKDKKIGRIVEKDLIPNEEFQKKMQERNINISLNNKKRAKANTLFNGWNYDIEKAQEIRKKTLIENPSIQINANKKHSKTKQSVKWKNTIGKEQAKKQSETKQSVKWKIEKEPIRVKKFKESFAKTFDKQKYDERVLQRAKYKNFQIFNDKHEVVFEYKGLLTEFCRINNLPKQAIEKSCKEKPLYNTKAGLRNAKIHNYEKYKGYYLVLL